MFTRIAKGMLFVLTIVILILAVIITVSTGGNFLVFMGVALFGGIFLFSFGIFVELANNIMDIKDILTKATNNSTTIVTSTDKVSTASKAQIIIEDAWVCNKCGTKNSLNTTWCAFCGKETRTTHS